jgi:hypothetical protein
MNLGFITSFLDAVTIFTNNVCLLKNTNSAKLFTLFTPQRESVESIVVIGCVSSSSSPLQMNGNAVA